MPFLAIVGDIAHRIGARADDARNIEQSILAGQETCRFFEPEAELANVVRVVLDREEPARRLLRQEAALVMIAQTDLDLAVGQGMRLAAEKTLALLVAL